MKRHGRRPAEHLFDTLSKGRRAANAVKAVDRRHPEDYTIGLPVHWYRDGLVMSGHVTKVTYDKHRPAYVRGRNGKTYIPHAADYCNDPGVYTGTLQDNVNQSAAVRTAKKVGPPSRTRAKLRKLLRSASPWAAESTWHVPLPFPPGMYIVGSIMGRGEYATGQLKPRPMPPDYDATLRQILFTLRDLHGKHPECGYARMAEVVERLAAYAHVDPPDFKGWYTHGCGQWVHDKLAPCSVCKPKRKRK